VVLALAAVSAAYPAGPVVGRTGGATFVQLTDGHGFASTRVRGTYFGRIDRGRIIATRNVSEAGCEARRRLQNGFRLCRGRNITFHTPSDARWRVRLRGHGISATGWVRGCLRLDARNSGSTGTFKIGFDGAERPWPRSLTTYKLGSGSC
jgi:hypothetical protein